jgi:hypothetical protein
LEGEAIQAVTTRYLVVREVDGARYVLYHLVNGKRVPGTLDDTQYRCLFHSAGDRYPSARASWKSGKWKEGRSEINFGGANITDCWYLGRDNCSSLM